MTDFLSKIFQKTLNYKILYEISTGGSRGVTLGRTDGERDRHYVIFLNLETAQIRNREVYTINTHRCCDHIDI